MTRFTRRTARAFLPTVLALAGPLQADVLIQPQDVVAVCDDSFPGARESSVDIADYLLMCQPVPGVRVMNLGMNRESIGMFMSRVEIELAPFQPNVVISSVGMGDGQAASITPNVLGDHTKYRAQTIDALKKIGVRTVVLASTGCFDSFAAPGDAWNKNLESLRDADRQVAATANVAFADPLQALLDAMPKAKAKYGDKYSFAFDGFHSTGAAQLIKAYAYLKALGCNGAIGTITIDLTANTAVGTDGQRIISCDHGSVTIESTHYPFCFAGNPGDANSTSGVIDLIPFNEDLNRYLLVVKGLQAANAKVTWGTESRTFPAADLSKGINLAAAFAAHTPFDAAFAKVEQAIWQQQEPQPTYELYFFHHLADYKVMVADQTELIDQVAAAITVQDKSRASNAAAQVVPVRHTLKIEELP